MYTMDQIAMALSHIDEFKTDVTAAAAAQKTGNSLDDAIRAADVIGSDLEDCAFTHAFACEDAGFVRGFKTAFNLMYALMQSLHEKS